MAGICESCGEVTEKLHTCDMCGAQVCSDCMKPSGCKVCGGVRKIE
ncbi:MAG: orotate phosphoribosyltransferase [Candidatus Nanohaloarchaea archaeon]|nr:orotate phosphoribosyltransferase [Candidatus Nanohaloarchaea archaeon]